MTSLKQIGLTLLTALVAAGAVAYWLKLQPGRTVASEPILQTNAPRVEKEIMVQTQEVVVVKNEFSWEQLESEDYKTYIARLRAIGCPEQTIRDIIISDLDKLLSPAVQAIYGRKADLNYWNSEEEELANNHDQREWTKREREIDRQKREIVKELMGVDLVRERLKQRGFEDYYERRLSFLPEEKRGDVRTILEKYDDEERAIRDKELEDGEALSDADRGRLQQLRTQREQELAATLSPEERQAYDLWLSPSANAVRYSMYGMDASEQEFLGVYQLRKGFDTQWNPEVIDWQNDQQVIAYQQAREELEGQIRQQLGDERYLDYKRGEDPDFHHLNAAVSRYKLDRTKAADAYEIKRAVVQTIANVRTDPNLSPAQVEETIKSVKGETEFMLRQTLGNGAYQYFQRRAQARWFE